MNIIAAVDNHWAIGNRNDLLVRIPNDQKFFREETMGKVIVLGRKTLETFPQGMPLQGRKNIILSTNRDYRVKNALVLHSLDELLDELENYRSQDIYVVGGASIYRQMLPYCDVAHITKIDRCYEADCYFPDLDQMPEWQITQDSEEQTYFDLEYLFQKYERRSR
ncbi:dihydrofolate reductase [Lachnospiraceae bacterium JLR.KK008]